MRVTEALIAGPNDVLAVKRLNSRLLIKGRGSFMKVPTSNAGGRGRFGSTVFASTFRDYTLEALQEVVGSVPWSWPERTMLVVPSIGSWTVQELRRKGSINRGHATEVRA